MSITPTGRLFSTEDGTDLVLSRMFRAPVDDVWAGVTESERTATWFGHWKGDAAPGRTIQVQMSFEEQAPWCDLRIDACRLPHHLAVSMLDDNGTWRLELRLTEEAGTTTLDLVHHLSPNAPVGEIGPGWEYYLDMLTAARDGSPRPDFDDYYPEQKGYFEGLLPEEK